MTAYGYGELQSGQTTYVCEIRTLNSRYLEVNVRMPRNLLALEIDLINHVKASLRRGKVDVFVDTAKGGGARDLPSVDADALRHYASVLRTMQEAFPGNSTQIDLTRLLTVDGLLDAKTRGSKGQDAAEAHREPLFKALNQALEGVHGARKKEGAALGTALLDLLQSLEGGRTEVAKHHDEIMAHLHKNYVKRLEAFLATLAKQGQPVSATLPPEERLITEVAVLADKADIDEELTRLATHITEFKRLMASEEGAGRKLDFLCQEMHREVNTMSNKLVQTEVSQHTIEMKQTVERIRQQVQNIE
jgi:uncharacterized protein (TIGR00255 family)